MKAMVDYFPYGCEFTGVAFNWRCKWSKGGLNFDLHCSTEAEARRYADSANETGSYPELIEG